MAGCLDTTTATSITIGTSWEQSSLWNSNYKALSKRFYAEVYELWRREDEQNG
jgi:hypothetical protein